MDNTIKITLIGQSYEKDPFGQLVPKEITRTIWGRKSPITRAEWGEAGRQGVNPSFQVKIRTREYRGELVAEIHGERYGIYRSYQAGETTELYLQKKVGDYDQG